MEESINSLFREYYKDISDEEIKMMPILKLAFLGDSVFELCVRSFLIKEKHAVKFLHKEKVNYVNARSQAKLLENILPLLDESESDFVRRAKNTKVNTVPKNSNQREYRLATALEALIGLLFLKNREDRIFFLLKEGWKNESSITTSDSGA